MWINRSTFGQISVNGGDINWILQFYWVYENRKQYFYAIVQLKGTRISTIDFKA